MNHSQLTRSTAWLCGLVASFIILQKLPVTPVAADIPAPVLFSDDFSGTLDNWHLLKGKPEHWQLNNGRLEAVINTSSTVTELAPKPALWDNSWDNIAISFDMTPLQGVDRNFSFWNQDTSNWSEFHFTSTFVQLFRIVAGKLDWLNDTPYVLANGTTYHVTVKRYRTKMELWINGVKITEHTETNPVPYTGPFALRAGSGSIFPVKVAFDNLTVTNLSAASPGWSFKQADPQWGALTYDHAETFSTKPTIARWGCLLTSMVMNFHYHGLTKMPTGETVTPLTLNAWLLAQPDGFLDGGLINWMAVTRLSRLINEVYNTPKLEYQRHDGSSMVAAVQALQNNLLPILSIPGHFMIAHGVISNGTDFAITDPGYAYTSFSQHKASLLSTRVFVPSFTDLSYIMVTHDPRITVQLLDPQTQQPISGTSTQVEYLSADEDPNEKSPALATTQLAKPSSGNYLVKISPTTAPLDPSWPVTPSLLPTRLYTYSETATVGQWTLPNPTTAQPQTYWLQYAKTNTSVLKPLISFASIRQEVDNGYTQKHITTKAAWQKLNTTATQGEKAAQTSKTRYISLLRQYLTAYKNSIQPTLFAQLEMSLQLLENQPAW